MKVRAPLMVALALLAGPAFAQKVFIDHDQTYDFDGIETFAWAKTPDTSVEKGDPLLHSRIVHGIEHQLSMGGIREVESDPDIYITYHTSTKEEMSVNTTSYGYGYPGAWAYGGYGRYYGGGGMGMSSATVTTYEMGTLIVDAWDRETEKLVWRGTAANITISPNPKKMAKRLDKALIKMASKWQSLKKKS